MENLIALALMTLVLVAIPGPNVALIVANSLKHGVRFGLVTVAGTTVGVGLQLALVVLGEGKSAKDPVLVSELKSTLSDVNAELESHQRLDYMFICKDPWTVENDLLTPSLKLKRHQIERFYSAKLPSDIPAEVIVE